MINIIYGLRDPRNDLYYYIGKSTIGINRPLEYLTKSHSNNVNEWVKMLEEQWLYPQIDIIEEVEILDNLSEREKYWINYYYDLNPELLNKLLITKQIIETRTSDDEEKFEFLSREIYNIQKILRSERIYRKLTQEKLAKLIGINRSTIVSIENGCGSLRNIQKYILTLKGFDIKTKINSERVRQNNRR